MITVVAAVISDDARILICQRRHDDRFPLLWEFPGGKIEPGESPEQALAREIKEELGVDAVVGREVYRRRHRYRELADALELIFYSVRLGANTPRNLAFEKIAWSARSELGSFDFLPADREFIQLLMRGKILL